MSLTDVSETHLQRGWVVPHARGGGGDTNTSQDHLAGSVGRPTMTVLTIYHIRIVAVIVSLSVLVLLGGLLMTQPSPSAQGEAELKNHDDSWKYTNALANQTSPYLLQHAHNPVDWHPWGPAAFNLARQTGKPIFLSIGYSTCYWCHVMERQVFENPKLAAVMNEHCINIKVDREERPDVDDIYMAAVQLMTSHGGWPMSVFLTPPGAGGEDDPGLKPFWAGTYIPPEPRHGMPGFAQVVEGLSNAWKTQRKEVIGQANQVAQAVRDHLSKGDGQSPLDPATVQRAAQQLMGMYDATDGGFGGAPKFPQPSNLQFLLKVYQNNPNEKLWEALAYTLERMTRGGMYDQAGGGFHRYSTDGQWLVPHFEKMLYDNGQLVQTYLTAQAIRPDKADPALYERVVRQTCDYVLREMTDASGVFWSAQDAEVDTREGLNYLWTPQEVREAIGDTELAQLAARLYGLDKGTNFQDPHHQDESPSNVLYLPVRLDEAAKREGITLEQFVAAKQQIDEKLLAVRDRRKQPGTDDKSIVAWNGMMIAALAQAGMALNEPRYTEAATRAASTILGHMREPAKDDRPDAPPGAPAQRGLLRTMRQSEAKIPAFLEDYAFFVHGVIELHRTTGDRRWQSTAQELMDIAQGRFSAASQRGGGYYDTLADQADLFVRTVSTYDGAIPTGNSQMIHNWVDLYELTQEERYLDQAVADLKSFSGSLARRGAAMVHMQHALLRVIEFAPGRFAEQAAMRDASGQAKRQVVSVAVDPEVVDLSDGQAQVRVTLNIGPEYHLNAADPGLVGLIPTELELIEAPGYELSVAYPPGVTKRYLFAEDELNIYEGTVVLEATIRRADSAATGGGQAKPQLVLRYQVCTDQSCLEPQRVELPVTFNTH